MQAEDVVGKQLIEARRLHLERAKGAKDDSQGGGGGGVASDETKEKDAKKVFQDCLSLDVDNIRLLCWKCDCHWQDLSVRFLYLGALKSSCFL